MFLQELEYFRCSSVTSFNIQTTPNRDWSRQCAADPQIGAESFSPVNLPKALRLPHSKEIGSPPRQKQHVYNSA